MTERCEAPCCQTAAGRPPTLQEFLRDSTLRSIARTWLHQTRTLPEVLVNQFRCKELYFISPKIPPAERPEFSVNQEVASEF